ncbi:uncharacterized protein TNCV_2126391 [Trichonephila clavipes]|nr:uncharacterized protein TNCV_2126391 [Trichonephila clavipes]
MYHDEIPERCKLNFTGIVDDALRIAGELFPKQTLKKYIRKEVEIDTDGRVRSRRFEKKEKSLKDAATRAAKNISWRVLMKPNFVSESLRAAAEFRLLPGHDCLCAHLFRFNLADSPFCALCASGKVMDASHPDVCSAFKS